MQHVTYDELFTFTLVIIGIVGLVLQALTYAHNKKK